MTKVHRAAFYPDPPQQDEHLHIWKVFRKPEGLTWEEAKEWLRRDATDEGWGPYKRVKRKDWHERDYVRNGASGGYVRRKLKCYRPNDWEGPDEYHPSPADMNSKDWEIVTTHAKWVDFGVDFLGKPNGGFWV